MTAPAPGGESLTGRVLGGHYLVGERIGAGAMGVVYRVRHTLLHRDFAAKVLAPGLAEDPDSRRRFLREAEGLTRITHRNVVPVRHFGEEEGLLYLVMDLGAGETLRDLLLREKTLPVERAAAIALQVLLALDAAHWEGVVHRDLKPANILVEPPDRERGGPERVRVLDFGLARVAPSGALPGPLSSAPGTVAGTVAYMSPEQVRGDADVDGRSDLFSLGSVLQEMLGGRPPFEGPSTLTVAMAILDRAPPPLPEEGPRAVPAPVRAVLLRALEKDRERRFRTAGEMADALRAAMSGESPAIATGPPPRARRVRWTLAASATALLALAAFAATRPSSSAPAAYDDLRAGADRDRALRCLLDARFEEAAAAAERVVDSGRGSAEDLLLLGRARAGIDDPRAMDDFLRAEALLSGDPRPGTERGRFQSLREWKELPAALVELDRVLARGPDPGALYARVWALHLRVRDLVEAGAEPAEREPVLASMAADAAALGAAPLGGVAEALVAWDGGDPERGFERARAAAELHPDLAEAPFVAAWISLRQARPELAPEDVDRVRRWFERAQSSIADAIVRARRRPGYLLQGRDLVRFWRISCMAKQAMGDPEGAAADFANEVLPRNGNSLADLYLGAQYQQQAGRFAEALRTYAAARRLGEGDRILHGEGYCHLQVARRRAEGGDLPGALADLDAAVACYSSGAAHFPEDPVFPAYRAEAWLTRARIQRDEAAAACLGRARADFDALEAAGMTGNPEVLFRRWEYFEVLGDRAAALADIRAAIAVGMHDTAAHHRRLAFSCIANASGPGARALLEEAVRAAGDAERWNPQRAELSCLIRGDARSAMAGLEEDPADRNRLLAEAREDYAKAESLGRFDPRVRAEARLRAAGALLARGDAAEAAAQAEEALRLRTASDASAGSLLFVNDYYLRSPLSAFHRRLGEAYAAAGRPEDAARENALAGALR